MALFDLLVVGVLLAVPHSYLLWMNSSEFGAPLANRVWIFAVPGLLVLFRLLLSRRRARVRSDSTIVLLYLGVLALGFANAMWRTAFPANVISVYGQYLYWMALVAAFLWAVADAPAGYVIDLIRRYYLVVAVIGVVYALLRLIFDEHLPHTPVMWIADGAQVDRVADNYYLSLAYREAGVYGIRIPRFTFLYREPRVLAAHMLIGLVLQTGFLVGQTTRVGRRRAAIGLIALLCGFLLANSVYAYALAPVIAVCLTLTWRLASPPRLWYRKAILLIAVLLLGFWPLVAWLGRNSGIEEEISNRFGKSLSAVNSYFGLREPVLDVPRRFPLGLGVMNLDSARYIGTYGVSSGESSTLIRAFAQHAGWVGLIVLAVIGWRLLGAVQRVAGVAAGMVKSGALLVGILLVLSATVIDSLTAGAEGMLLVGWLLATDAALRPSHGQVS